ncbi:hypothetical protein NQZ68_039734 [Dissostichus eleginoides]|nr:hypothetical protein NQZ68_039734 [Dissostichus eleginoides]
MSIRLILCKFGGWQADNCLRSAGNVSDRSEAAGRTAVSHHRCFLSAELLHPEAQQIPRASSQKDVFPVHGHKLTLTWG